MEKEKSHYEECKREVQSIEESQEFWCLAAALQEGALYKRVQMLFSQKTNNINKEEKEGFRSFFAQQVTLSNELLLKLPELESEDRMLVEESMLTAAALMLQDRRLTQCFFEELAFSRSLFLKGLFCKRSSNIRKIFSHVFFVLCHYFTTTLSSNNSSGTV